MKEKKIDGTPRNPGQAVQEKLTKPLGACTYFKIQIPELTDQSVVFVKQAKGFAQTISRSKKAHRAWVRLLWVEILYYCKTLPFHLPGQIALYSPCWLSTSPFICLHITMNIGT